MKRQLFICLLFAVFMASCATGSILNDSSQDLSDINGKEWKLLGVFIDGKDTAFNRDNQPDQLSKDIFTLKLEDGTISGVGAPNRYSGQYTPGANQTLGITPLRSTLMASLFEPENLREHDFFTYVQNTRTWNLVNSKLNLEVLSVTGDGKPVRMVFGL